MTLVSSFLVLQAIPISPFHFEEMIFPLVSTIFNGLGQHCIFSHSYVHGYVVEITDESSRKLVWWWIHGQASVITQQ